MVKIEAAKNRSKLDGINSYMIFTVRAAGSNLNNLLVICAFVDIIIVDTPEHRQNYFLPLPSCLSCI